MKRLLIMGFLFGVTLLSLPSCQKELSEESNTNNASFSLLNDSTKECLDTSVVNGSYYNGVTAALSGNFVTVVVNVKSTGNYTISSNTKNGFSFFDSGFFSKIGLDTLILQPRGKPIFNELTDFSFGDSTCPFTVDVQDSTGTGLGGVDTSGGGTVFADSSYTDASPASENAWHFTDSISGKTYSGTFADSATITTDEDNVTTLTFGGFTTDLSQLFGGDLDLPGGDVKTGVYQMLNSDNDLGLINIAGIALYDSDEDIAGDGLSNSYITITSYDPVTRQIKGSFHCWSEDENGDNFTLIKGSFNMFISKQ